MVVFYRIGQIGRAGKKPAEPPTGRSAGLYTAQDPRAVAEMAEKASPIRVKPF